MGNYLDRWREYPLKGGSAPCKELHVAYTKALERAQMVPETFKIRLEGKPYYWIGHRTTKEIRDFVADNWRDCGFSVRIRGDDIYARRR